MDYGRDGVADRTARIACRNALGALVDRRRTGDHRDEIAIERRLTVLCDHQWLISVDVGEEETASLRIAPAIEMLCARGAAAIAEWIAGIGRAEPLRHLRVDVPDQPVLGR